MQVRTIMSTPRVAFSSNVQDRQVATNVVTAAVGQVSQSDLEILVKRLDELKVDTNCRGCIAGSQFLAFVAEKLSDFKAMNLDTGLEFPLLFDKLYPDSNVCELPTFWRTDKHLASAKDFVNAIVNIGVIAIEDKPLCSWEEHYLPEFKLTPHSTSLIQNLTITDLGRKALELLTKAKK